jgi:hypothetical protein
MKTRYPNRKTKVVTTAKEQSLGTPTAPSTFVVKDKPNSHVESMVPDEADEVPVMLACSPFSRVSSPRTRNGSSEKRQEEFILEAGSKFNWSFEYVTPGTK